VFDFGRGGGRRGGRTVVWVIAWRGFRAVLRVDEPVVVAVCGFSEGIVVATIVGRVPLGSCCFCLGCCRHGPSGGILVVGGRRDRGSARIVGGGR
jgi:hypothetical protein